MKLSSRWVTRYERQIDIFQFLVTFHFLVDGLAIPYLTKTYRPSHWKPKAAQFPNYKSTCQDQCLQTGNIHIRTQDNYPMEQDPNLRESIHVTLDLATLRNKKTAKVWVFPSRLSTHRSKFNWREEGTI